MRRVQRREMEKLFSRGEAAHGGEWPVAPRYPIVGDVIYPDVDLNDVADQFLWAGEQVTRIRPLAEHDAFLTFARLAAGGEPSKHAISKWVHKYGLLRRLKPKSHFEVVLREEVQGLKRNVLNQKPITLKEFRTEARYAHELLDLFQTVRSGDSGELHKRMVSQRTTLPHTPAQRRIVQLLGGQPALNEMIEKDVLAWSRLTLEWLIEKEIAEVRHAFFRGGKLGLTCPDLRTALYWQFACLVGGKQPLDICKGCEGLFVKRRRNHLYCNSTCRSRKSREDK